MDLNLEYESKSGATSEIHWCRDNAKLYVYVYCTPGVTSSDVSRINPVLGRSLDELTTFRRNHICHLQVGALDIDSSFSFFVFGVCVVCGLFIFSQAVRVWPFLLCCGLRRLVYKINLQIKSLENVDDIVYNAGLKIITSLKDKNELFTSAEYFVYSNFQFKA